MSRYNGFNTGDGVVLSKGGTITNGSEADTTASIEGFTTGVHISGAKGTVNNFGIIGGTYYPNNSFGIELDAGGTVINGSATDNKADIYGQNGGIYMSGVGEYITNFGTIDGGSGLAIQCKANSGAKLIEEGSGVLVGGVSLVGGTLELAGDAGAGTFTGIGSQVQVNVVQIDTGASWTFTGANTFNVGGLVNYGTFINRGTFTNNTSDGEETILFGQTINSGTIANANSKAVIVFDGDYSITTDPSLKTGSFSNKGTVEKIAGTGTSIIRTGADGTLTSSGRIKVDTGTLELTGASVSISGVIQGAGTLEFGPGAIALSSQQVTVAGLLLAGTGADLTVAANLTYAGAFTDGEHGSDNRQRERLHPHRFGFADQSAHRRAGSTQDLRHDDACGSTMRTSQAGLIRAMSTETGQLTLSSKRTTNVSSLKGAEFDITGNVGITATTATQFSNAGLLKKMTGSLSTLAVNLLNNGTVEVASGKLDLQNAVSGTGKLQIDSGKQLQADAAVASGQTVTFHQGNDKLILTDAADFAGKLSGFTVADTLDLRQFGTVSSLTFTENAQNTGGTLVVKDGSLTTNIAMLGQYVTSGFATKTDGSGGTNVTYKPPASPDLAVAPHRRDPKEPRRAKASGASSLGLYANHHAREG